MFYFVTDTTKWAATYKILKKSTSFVLHMMIITNMYTFTKFRGRGCFHMLSLDDKMLYTQEKIMCISFHACMSRTLHAGRDKIVTT